MLKLYNTLTRRIEPLIVSLNQITIYVCGITPYDTTHVGHAFTYVVFDTLVRFLRWQGYQVIYTQNVTDIDDPLFERARKLGIHWKSLGDRYTKQFLTDMRLLNLTPPDYFPKVSQEIDTIIPLVTKLINKGYAYKRNGNVYFDIKRDPQYGKLSRLPEKKMMVISRERGSNPDDPHKKHPLDFLLWQTSREDEPRWESPWGKGRPGWHIECSAMAIKYLGKQIAIHGGGKDLIFPHHESEIAQSEAYTGKSPLAYHWIHIGMTHYKGEKMSKSLGNLVLVSDLLKKYSPGAIRWYLLSRHYRQDWEFNEGDLDKSQLVTDRIEGIVNQGKQQRRKKRESAHYLQQFIQLISKNLDIPKALELIMTLAKKETKQKKYSQLLRQLITVLGLPLSNRNYSDSLTSGHNTPGVCGLP